MAELMYNDLTEKGMALFTKVNKGNYEYPLKITGVSVGSGQIDISENPYLQENLINYEYSLKIIGYENNGDGQTTITAMIDNKDILSGFYAFEFGIFAFDEELQEEILYSYISMSKPNWIAPGTLAPETNIINFITAVGKADNIVIVIDESTSWVTQKTFQDLKDELEFHDTGVIINHNLNTYPKVMVFEVLNGYGATSYSEKGYGDLGLNHEILNKTQFIDRNNIKLYVNKELNGEPTLKQISEKVYLLQYLTNSLYISL